MITNMKIKNWGRAVLHFLYPKRCAACGTILPNEEHMLCLSCEKEFHRDKMLLCLDCNREQPACRCPPREMPKSGPDVFLHVIAYPCATARRVLPKLKKHCTKEEIYFCAEEMATVLQNEIPIERLRREQYLVTFVPRRPQNVRVYGYDHARLLAKRIAELLGLPCLSLLSHKGGTQEQKLLSAAKRRRNAFASFELRSKAVKEIHDRKLIIVDDVITTGSSMFACTKHLRNAGATFVISLTFAKTISANRYATALQYLPAQQIAQRRHLSMPDYDAENKNFPKQKNKTDA